MSVRHIYIETSVISYLTGRTSSNLIVAAHQVLTQTWWEERAPFFTLFISELVYQEAAAGDPDAAEDRLTAMNDLKILTITDEAVDLAQTLVTSGPTPAEFAADALHIAIAAVHGIDYLLTWNCKHLANASHRAQIFLLVEEAGFACPVICTPEELMED